MVQAYYTKSYLAEVIGLFLDICGGVYVQTILDPCAGAGNLTRGFMRRNLQSRPPRELHLIEPDAATIPTLQALPSRATPRVFHMTCEEWARTYAKPDLADLTLCNPPFGERFGHTALGENVHDLHLPEFQRFETYFLTVCAAVTQGAMAFLIPDSYWRHAEAQPTLHRLAHGGWQLIHLRALPIDGYENALVNTSLWVFSKTTPMTDWVAPALDLIRTNRVPALFKNVETVTRKGRYEPVTGYLLPAPIDLPSIRADVYRQPLPFDSAIAFIAKTPFTPNYSLTFDWCAEPQPLGSLWERMGCMYQLTDSGWLPAQSQGFVDGAPVSAEFQTAQRAFRMLRKGAIWTSRALIADLNLPALRKAYGKLATGSFLHILQSGRTLPDPWGRDLENLGMLELDGADPQPPATHPTIERLGRHLISTHHLGDGQLCDLYLTYRALPPTLTQRLLNLVLGHQIPVEKLTLRATWMPREIIAEYLGLSLDRDGTFHRLPSYSAAEVDRGLVNFLNYGKAGGRIQPGDQEVFEAASREFAVAINDWTATEHQALRIRVHAHFIKTFSRARRVQQRLGEIQSAKPLHAYQKDDLPFCLSGQAILNWDVGLGKTLGAIASAAAHEGKTLIAVPKPVISKWAREITTFFPNLRFEVLGFRKGKKGFVLDIANLNQQAGQVFFDPAVSVLLTTHQVLARLKVRELDMVRADQEDAWDRFGGATGESRERARELMVKQAAERNFHFGGELTFTDLPLAGLLLIVDEAHQFKSLFPMPSSGWGETLVMAGQCGESKRARDLKIKADLVRQAGGKTLALTATPVSNSVAEIFNMLRIFAPNVLTKRGIRNTQQLMDTYCILDAITSVSPTGKIVSGQTITGFKNLDDLKTIWAEAMITRTAVDVKLPLPRVREIVVRVPPSPAIRSFMDAQKSMLDQAVRSRTTGEEQEVHLFTILSQLDAVAAYPATVGISSNPKGEKLAQTVWDIYREGDGGQIVFSDRIESQAGIRDLLVARGIPEGEIIIVNAATAPNIDDRLRIQDRFNGGETRVIIGGAVTSEGIDLQRNTVAIHFNNLAWEGQTIHQRKGRGVRQGNRNAEVRVYYYLLDGSTDNYRFLTTQNKNHWWESLRTAQTDRIAESVFSQPMSDDLIASLAANPEEILALLQSQRREKAQTEEYHKVEKLIRRMLSFADPKARAVSQPILATYEKTLRGLTCVTDGFADALIQRVESLAWFMDRMRCNARDRQWDIRDLRYALFLNDRDQHGVVLRQWFPIDVDEDGCFQFANPIDDLVKPEWLKRLPIMARTYGPTDAPEIHTVQHLETQHQPEILLIAEPEPKIGVRQAIEPELPQATLPEVPQAALLEVPEATPPVTPQATLPEAPQAILHEAPQATPPEAAHPEPISVRLQPPSRRPTGPFIPGVQMTFGFGSTATLSAKNPAPTIAKPKPSISTWTSTSKPSRANQRAVQLSFGF